jgi:hypothetical protein
MSRFKKAVCVLMVFVALACCPSGAIAEENPLAAIGLILGTVTGIAADITTIASFFMDLNDPPAKEVTQKLNNTELVDSTKLHKENRDLLQENRNLLQDILEQSKFDSHGKADNTYITNNINNNYGNQKLDDAIKELNEGVAKINDYLYKKTDKESRFTTEIKDNNKRIKRDHLNHSNFRKTLNEMRSDDIGNTLAILEKIEEVRADYNKIGDKLEIMRGFAEGANGQYQLLQVANMYHSFLIEETLKQRQETMNVAEIIGRDQVYEKAERDLMQRRHEESLSNLGDIYDVAEKVPDVGSEEFGTSTFSYSYP